MERNRRLAPAQGKQPQHSPVQQGCEKSRSILGMAPARPRAGNIVAQPPGTMTAPCPAKLPAIPALPCPRQDSTVLCSDGQGTLA